jgi:hypothetical protein
VEGCTAKNCAWLVLADHGVSGVSTRLCERAEGRRLLDILREGDGALPFEAKLAATSTDETGVRRLHCDLRPPVLKQAAQLFKDGLSVRDVAWTFGGRPRQRI